MEKMEQREIKFRVWDNFHLSKKNCFFYSDVGMVDFWQWISQHPGSKKNITQFTGLLDKNGKEIYEGDILENINKEIKFGPFTTYFQGEYWNTDGSTLEWETNIEKYLIESCPSQFFQRKYINKSYTNSGKLDGQPVIGLLNSCDNSSIIGNIFENSELLNK